MRALTIFLLLLISAKCWTCSELGTLEFQVPEKAKARAGKLAGEYAKALALSQFMNESSFADELRPPYIVDARSSITDAKKARNGFTSSFTISASFKTKTDWDCLYCAEFEYDSADSSVIFRRIMKHHCAK